MLDIGIDKRNYSKDDLLKDVLVVTTRKSFWASPESEVFPNRLYTRIFYGNSANRVNSFFLLLRVLVRMWLKKPKIIFVGSACRVGRWLAWLKKRMGLRVKLIVTNRLFSGKLASHIDRCIVYEKREVSLYGDPGKYVFTPLPPDGNFARDTTPAEPLYIFSGGGSKRDFGTLIEAVKALPIQLRIVTHSPKTLGYDKPLPPNCQVEYVMPLDDFLDRIARSLFVVIPLQEGQKPRGQTTVLQAMALGKCVVTNDIPANWDYITPEKNGILLPSGDVSALKHEILRLLHESERRARIALEAQKTASGWTYEGFCRCIVNVCESVLSERNT